MKELIRDLALASGFSACGFTSARVPDSAQAYTQWVASGYQGEMHYLSRTLTQRLDPQKVLPGVRSVICLAASYAEPSPSPAPSLPGFAADPAQALAPIHLKAPFQSRPGPVTHAGKAAPPAGFIARYARGTDYHHVLLQPLKELVNKLQELGGPLVKSMAYTDTGPVLERDLAQRAGLGFIGKHTNLISRSWGNWIFLAEILTTLELAPDLPEHNRCGTCRRCLDSCPTGALVGPFQLDARRCLAYLTIEYKGAIPVELRPVMGQRIFGCDDCLAVCPWNRFAHAGRLLANRFRPDLQQPELLELLQFNRTTFKQRFGDTPLHRIKLRGLLRNVCIALGNVGNQSALPALTALASGPDLLVAEHADWATQHLRKRMAAGDKVNDQV